MPRRRREDFQLAAVISAAGVAEFPNCTRMDPPARSTFVPAHRCPHRCRFSGCLHSSPRIGPESRELCKLATRQTRGGRCNLRELGTGWFTLPTVVSAPMWSFRLVDGCGIAYTRASPETARLPKRTSIGSGGFTDVIEPMGHRTNTTTFSQIGSSLGQANCCGTRSW